MVSSVSSRAPEAGRVIKGVSVASQSASRVSADDPDARDGSEARDDRDCHGDRLVSREERDGLSESARLSSRRYVMTCELGPIPG
jgi:hypothetical protein